MKKPYSPQFRSGGYAILVVMYEEFLRQGYEHSHDKDPTEFNVLKEFIVTKGERYCERPMLPTGTNHNDGNHYEGYQAMKTLRDKKLVIAKKRRKAHFHFSTRGLDLARHLWMWQKAAEIEPALFIYKQATQHRPPVETPYLHEAESCEWCIFGKKKLHQQKATKAAGERGLRRCSSCGEEGHDKRKCPLKGGSSLHRPSSSSSGGIGGPLKEADLRKYNLSSQNVPPSSFASPLVMPSYSHDDDEAIDLTLSSDISVKSRKRRRSHDEDGRKVDGRRKAEEEERRKAKEGEERRKRRKREEVAAWKTKWLLVFDAFNKPRPSSEAVSKLMLVYKGRVPDLVEATACFFARKQKDEIHL